MQILLLLLIHLATTTTNTTTTSMILNTAIGRRVTRSSLYAIAFGHQGARDVNASEKRIGVLSDAIMKTIETDDEISKEKITKRVLDYYVPVALWLESQILKGKNRAPPRIR